MQKEWKIYTIFETERDTWYQLYLTDAAGPADERLDDYLAVARAHTGQVMDSAAAEAALDRLEAQVGALRQRGQVGGYAPWLVDGKLYDGYYGTGSLTRQRFNAAIAVLFVAFCCAGLGAYEAHCGMAVQVRTTRRGRGALLARKAAIAAALAAAVWAMIYLRELRHMLSALGISTLDAPVQNIDALAAFPWAVTLKGYLAILYGVRLVMLVATAWVSLCLSHFCRSLQSAYLLCTGVVGLPALLTAFGVGALKWVSPIVPVSGAELLWGMGSGSFAHLIPWAVMLALGIAALALGYRKWVWN